MEIEALRRFAVENSPGLVARVEELLGKRLDGDQILRTLSSEEDWQRLQGSEGIALVRRGYVVDSFVIRMN